jgi:hypothetical protein
MLIMMWCSDGECDVLLMTNKPRSFLDDKPMTDAHGLYCCPESIETGF